MDLISLEQLGFGSGPLLSLLAVISIIATQVWTTKLNSIKIDALTKQVEKQNGRLGQTVKRIRNLEIRCAGRHGGRPVLDDEDKNG